MVECVLDRTFAALGDETRLALIEELARGERTVGELAEPFTISFQAVSKHLAVLERAGMISRTRDGREVRCRLELRAMADATRWLERNRQRWERRLDRLEALLDEGRRR